MGWKDRAIEDTSVPKASGGWRNRAVEDPAAQKMTLQRGDETAEIDANPEALHEAESRGFNTPEAQAHLSQAKPRQPYSPVVSALQGVTTGVTMGFDDRLSGLIAAAKAGGTMKNPIDAYSQERDRYRSERTNAEQDNPVSSFGGNLVGGAAVPLGYAAKSARIGSAIMAGMKSGAVQGAIGGVARSKELNDFGDTAGNAVFGGATGGLTGGLLAGGVHGIKNPGQAREAITETIPSYLRSMVSGAKEAGKAVEGTGAFGQAIAAPAGAIKGVKDQYRQNENFQNLVDTSKAAGDAGGRVGKGLTDKEYALRVMLEKGKSPIKRNYADQGASQYPGQLDADKYNDLLEMGSPGRELARGFNKDEHGAKLVPHFEKTKEVFRQARNQRYGELQEKAAGQYQGSDDILMHIGDALEDAASTNETKGIQGILSDIQNKVAAGKGNRRAGLQEGDWGSVDGSERFKRIQAARQQIDAKRIWAKKEGLSEAEHILQDLRDKFDAELKFSPDKVEGDRMYRNAKGLDKSMFNKVDFDKEGQVDKYKIGNMLQSTERGKRFRDNVGRFEEFIADPNLNPKVREEGKKLLSEFKGAADLAEQQRALNNFRYANGPSSPAIERQTAAMGGETSPLTEAIRAPSGFMNSIDQFAKNGSRRYFGKAFQELSDGEKDTLVRMKFWESKNKGFSDDEAMAYFNKIKKKGSNPIGKGMSQLSDDEASKISGGAGGNGFREYLARGKASRGMPNLDQLTDAETSKVAGGAADNNVVKRTGELDNPMGKFVMRRDVNHNGENLKHEVYKLNGELVHSLVDESGRRMAEIRGKMMKYKGKEGFAIHNSASAPNSKGHGKKLYDLALDTHNQVFSDTSLSPKGSRPVYEEHYPNQPGVEVTPDTRGTRDRFQVDLKNKDSFRQKGQIKDFDSEDGKSLEEINKVKWLTRFGLHGQPVDDFDNYSIPGPQRPSPPVPDQRLQRMESGVERAGWILKHTGDLDIAIKHLESTMGMSRLEAIQAVKTAVSNRESQAIHPKVQNAINREAQTQHTPRSLLEEDIAQGFQDGYRPAEVFNSFRGRDGISDAELRAIIGRRAGGS